ncbi:MAG: hypothetical protein FH756_14355 [Firmicutes bacterium]|nr:hypothetical protein [Bacillota bacterium]
MDNNFIKRTGEPPLCAAPDEVQHAIIGLPFSVDIVASDPDGQVTGIEAVNLPQWASLNIITDLPAPDAVARISGLPAENDIGLYDMSIAVVDNDGNKDTGLLKIKVEEGYDDDQPGVL